MRCSKYWSRSSVNTHSTRTSKLRLSRKSRPSWVNNLFNIKTLHMSKKYLAKENVFMSGKQTQNSGLTRKKYSKYSLPAWVGYAVQPTYPEHGIQAPTVKPSIAVTFIEFFCVRRSNHIIYGLETLWTTCFWCYQSLDIVQLK